MTTATAQNALSLLKHDHQKVKSLFDQYEKAKLFSEKKPLALEAMKELKIHVTIEEERFYPVIREEVEDVDLVFEALEEHHVVKMLMAELAELKEDEQVYTAKYQVLMENVRHHIKEEEGLLFPEVRKTDIDMDILGGELLQRKEELMSKGVPTMPEEVLIRHT